MRTKVGTGLVNALVAPSTTADVSVLEPPAFVGRGDDAHSRSTSSFTARSGVNTIRSVPATFAPVTVTSAVTTGRRGSGAVYAGQLATGATEAAAVRTGVGRGEAVRDGVGAISDGVGTIARGFAADPELHAARTR